MTTREPQVRAEPTPQANPAGNERLTAMTGVVLLVLFVAECLTLLDMGKLLTLHVFLGMLLLGPVGLCCAVPWPSAWGWRSLPITSRPTGAARAASSR